VGSVHETAFKATESIWGGGVELLKKKKKGLGKERGGKGLFLKKDAPQLNQAS